MAVGFVIKRQSLSCVDPPEAAATGRARPAPLWNLFFHINCPANLKRYLCLCHWFQAMWEFQYHSKQWFFPFLHHLYFYCFPYNTCGAFLPQYCHGMNTTKTNEWLLSNVSLKGCISARACTDRLTLYYHIMKKNKKINCTGTPTRMWFLSSTLFCCWMHWFNTAFKAEISFE